MHVRGLTVRFQRFPSGLCCRAPLVTSRGQARAAKFARSRRLAGASRAFLHIHSPARTRKWKRTHGGCVFLRHWMFYFWKRSPPRINHGGLGEDQAAGAAEAMARILHRQSVALSQAGVAERCRERTRGSQGRAQRPDKGPLGVSWHRRNRTPPQSTVRRRLLSRSSNTGAS